MTYKVNYLNIPLMHFFAGGEGEERDLFFLGLSLQEEL